MVLILMLLNVAVDGGASSERDVMTRDAKQALESAKAGIEVGAALSELVEKKDFVGTLANLTKSLGPFLGAIGPFVGFILSFLPAQESAELAYMKKMMKNIDNRFDRVDSRFNDIERLINWDTYKINLVRIEQNILSLSDKFKSFRESSSKAISRDEANIFISHYENIYDDSGFKLYEIITQRGVFSEDLGDAVMKATKYDRRSTQEFLLGALKLLLQAVKLELAYYHMKHPTSEHQHVMEWEQKIRTVHSALSHIDYVVSNKYNDQAAIELDDYLTKYYKHSNVEFANAFYAFLTHKYYWRDWLVLAYNPISGFEKHTLGLQGHLKFRTGGRNAAFASVDKSRPKINVAATKATLDHIRQDRKTHGLIAHHVSLKAQDVYNAIDKKHAAATAVIKKGSDLHIKCTSDRVAFSTSGKYFDILLWG